MEQYNVLETNRPAVDRNKRGRDDYQTGGGSVSINGGTQTEGSAAEEGHHHDNLTTLNKLSDSEGYLKLKAASVAEATGEVTVTDEKVKAGYADRAHDLDEDSPANDRFLNRKKEDEALERIRFRKGLEAEGASTFHGGLLVRSPLGARQLKTAISSALIEEGDPCVMNLSLIEEGDGNTETLSTSLSEVPAASGATTLGELENVDPAFDTLKPGKYGFEVKSDGIICPVPAASLGVGSRITLKAKSDISMTVLSSDTVALQYEFTSLDASGSPTGAGTASYTVNGVRVATVPVEQGIVSWDCSKYLSASENTITVSVTDSYSANRILTFTVRVVALSISSTFDEFQPYTGDVQFRYTPVGAIAKTVVFKLDNKAVASIPTTANNRQMTQTIPAQSHGEHILEVYIEASVGDRTVRSNVLRYAVVCYVSGNSTPVIASSFNVSSACQYGTLAIPFFVYNPAASTASVSLKSNGTVVSERIVDRTRQVWNYRADKAGSLTLDIAAGSVFKSFTLNITASEIDVSAETEHLQLYLTAAGRSNSEAHPEQWTNNGVSAALTGFNFVTNGWVADEKGIVSLKVSGDARVAIPVKIFGDDFRATGKTIEFELSTTDVVDYNAIVTSCMNGGSGIEITAQSASLHSEQSAINTRFKEDERVRVSFVVEDRSGSRLIYTYIDGIASGVVQYPADDNFMQAEPAGIVVGSNDCTVCIHNIRVYQAALNQFQMLDNCIADMDDMQTKIAMYTRNQVFDSYGDVSYPKVLEQLPGLTIIGDLPTFKGDKKTVVMVYEDRQNPARSWRAENVQIDVQGTSSQYYPRKNFKAKCKNGFIMTTTGEVVNKFAVREGEIPVNTFCFKADFAESSGTHNTGMAKIIDRVLRAMNYLAPPQKSDARVRTTVDGYPFTIFHRATESSPLEFVGKYNFNNDKSTQETFGFTAGCECWEVKNNTSDRVLFLKSDYTLKDAEGNPDWLNDFEARYPDDDDLNAEYATGKIPVNLKRLTDWLVSTKGNPTKFKAEAGQYLDLNFILSYYSITELFAMVDQRAKNMFLTTYDGVHWAVIFYDNDTCLGINNEGAVAFGYDVEYHDAEGSGQVWNGEQSVLWNNVEAAYLSEITAMYQTMRSSGAISYNMCIDVLNGEQSGKWCEAIYNADGKFKYIDPLLNEGNGSYLYALQGSRSQHRKWWLYNRFRYIDSKYVAGDFKNDYVTMRLYTPTVWQGVKPNADFTLTPAGDVYVTVKYGSYTIARRGHKGAPIVIKAPEIAFNDTETIVYGAAYIGSLGDLSAMYPGTVDISKATKLTELIAGSSAVGYQNSNLTVLAIGNNTLFRRLNVMNCNRLTQPVDVSGCENIEEIYAQGTGTTSVKLPPAGNVRELHLPGTITNLTVKNQRKLSGGGFSIDGVAVLATIWWENTAGTDVFALIERCLALETKVLARVRLTGINGRGGTLAALSVLAGLGGMDENGNGTNKAVVTGSYHADTASEDELGMIRSVFPELSVTYDKLEKTPVRTIGVRIYNTTTPVAGAKVLVNGKEYTTDELGKINHVGREAVNVSISKEGYKENAASFKEITRNTSNYVFLQPIVNVTFTVKETGGMMVDGADVTFDSETKKTVGGKAAFKKSWGDYAYSVSYMGVSTNGTLHVETSDATKELSLEIPFSSHQPAWNGNIQLMLSGASVQIPITSTTSDYVINWGDGTNSNATGTGSVSYTHAYTDGKGNHNIEISGCNNITSCLPAAAALIAYWSIGNSKVNNLSFNSYTALKAVGADIFNNDINRNNFSSCFKSCSGLTSIPVGLFDNCTAVTNFSDCFIECYVLTSIPVGLFDNCTAVTSFSYCFYNCTVLTSIPVGLFDNCTAVTNFSYCFRECYGLTSIPVGLFDNCTAVTNFYNCFSSCTGLTSALPALWIQYYGKNISKTDCFYACAKASNWLEVPISWGGTAPEWHPAFNATISVKIFKDNLWWLNQGVSINGVSFAQQIDGSYSAAMTGIRAESTYPVLVNGTQAGSIIIKEGKTEYLVLAGDCSSFYTINADYTTGNIHPEIIASNDGWAFDSVLSGLKSKKIGAGGSTSLSLNVNEPVEIIYGQSSETNFDFCTIYNNDNTKLLELKGSSFQGTSLLATAATTNGLKFTYKKDGSGDTGSDAFWIKSIHSTVPTLPPLPATFIPNTMVSGAVRATYRSTDARLANIERLLNIT